MKFEIGVSVFNSRISLEFDADDESLARGLATAYLQNMNINKTIQLKYKAENILYQKFNEHRFKFVFVW